jgi:hypothetical protein
MAKIQNTIKAPKTFPEIWQPIASAPRDGTFVLTKSGPWQPCITHFATYDGRTRWGSSPEGFMTEEEFLRYWHEVSYEPTEWMPLPVDDVADAIETAYRNGFEDGERHAGEAAPPQTSVEGPPCCMCGKTNLSIAEGDGGQECQLSDGRWVCSPDCWDRAVEPPETPLPGPGLLEIAKLAGIHDIRYPTNAAMQAFLVRIFDDWDHDRKRMLDQARVSGFAEGIEKAASIADLSAADFEKQAEGKEDPHAHDALLLAADACELTADAIRAVMGGSTE